MPTKRKQPVKEEGNFDKSFAPSSSQTKKKQKGNGEGRATPAKATKWSDEEIRALFTAIHGLAKANAATFTKIPELRTNGRNASNIHIKIDSVFKEKFGVTKGK